MKLIPFLFLHAFISLLIHLPGNAQNTVQITLPAFVQAGIDSIYAKEKFPGILVGIRTNGKNEYYTAGYAVPASKKKFDSNTFFEAGSITKTFTAYILEAVLRDHNLSDSNSILPFLPDSVRENKAFVSISFLMLMNHTSGLPRLPENMILEEGNLQPYENYDSKMLFAYLKTATPLVSTRSVYSNLGMALAGVLAERISGKTYAKLLDEYIFLPFKIIDESNSIEKSNNKSQGYFSDEDKVPYWNMNVMAPAGGLKCSAGEMLLYLSCISKPINKKDALLIDTLLRPTASVSNNVKVCRAWHTLQQKDKPIIYWHNGGTYGFATFAAFLKDTDQAIIVVINKFNSNNISDKLGFMIMNKLME